MVRVRGHWRRKRSGGYTWVRPHIRRYPATVAAAGGGGIVVILILVAVIAYGCIPDMSGGAGNGTSREGDALAVPVPTPPTIAELAQELSDAREAAGLSESDAARQAGIPVARLREIESGAVSPTDVEVFRLCQAYRLPPEVQNAWMEVVTGGG